MASFTSVTNISMSEDTTLTYSYSVLESLANESADITAFKFVSIDPNFKITDSTGNYTITSVAGSMYVNNVGVSKVWYTSSGLIVVSTSDIRYTLSGSIKVTPKQNLNGLNIAFGLVGGDSYVELTANEVPVKISINSVNDTAGWGCYLSGTDSYVGTTIYASNNITDIDGISVGAISYYWQKSANNGVTWYSIPGATLSSYTIIADDLNSKLRAVAVYTDDGGTLETFYSTSCYVFSTGTIPTMSASNPTYTGSEDSFINITYSNLKFKTGASTSTTVFNINTLYSGVKIVQGSLTITSDNGILKWSTDGTTFNTFLKTYTIWFSGSSLYIFDEITKTTIASATGTAIISYLPSNMYGSLYGFRVHPATGTCIASAKSVYINFSVSSVQDNIDAVSSINIASTMNSRGLLLGETVSVVYAISNIDGISTVTIKNQVSDDNITFTDIDTTNTLQASGTYNFSIVSPTFEVGKYFRVEMSFTDSISSTRTLYSKSVKVYASDWFPVYVNNGGNWINMKEVHVNINGTYVKAKSMFIKVNGSWDRVF